MQLDLELLANASLALPGVEAAVRFCSNRTWLPNGDASCTVVSKCFPGLFDGPAGTCSDYELDCDPDDVRRWCRFETGFLSTPCRKRCPAWLAPTPAACRVSLDCQLGQARTGALTDAFQRPCTSAERATYCGPDHYLDFTSPCSWSLVTNQPTCKCNGLYGLDNPGESVSGSRLACLDIHNHYRPSGCTDHEASGACI
jgi:hypothetical protein